MTPSVTINDTALITTYTLENVRDCSTISTGCSAISPKIQIDPNTGSFITASLPVQLLPNYKIRAAITVIDETLDAKVTFRGYRNEV
jgi:hypothetical protein